MPKSNKFRATQPSKCSKADRGGALTPPQPSPSSPAPCRRTSSDFLMRESPAIAWGASQQQHRVPGKVGLSTRQGQLPCAAFNQKPCTTSGGCQSASTAGASLCKRCTTPCSLFLHRIKEHASLACQGGAHLFDFWGLPVRRGRSFLLAFHDLLPPATVQHRRRRRWRGRGRVRAVFSLHLLLLNLLRHFAWLCRRCCSGSCCSRPIVCCRRRPSLLRLPLLLLGAHNNMSALNKHLKLRPPGRSCYVAGAW